MESRIAQLRYKEVISMEDGSRFGYVGDLEIDLERGQVKDRRIPWDSVQRFGEDIILVRDVMP